VALVSVDSCARANAYAAPYAVVEDPSASISASRALGVSSILRCELRLREQLDELRLCRRVRDATDRFDHDGLRRVGHAVERCDE
jgi:hypothetical protein